LWFAFQKQNRCTLSSVLKPVQRVMQFW